MADSKITDLTGGGDGQAGDEVPINRGGLDRKLNLTGIYNFLKTVFTTADVASSANKRYVTDAQLVVIGNTSGTNTGDQVNITGNAATATLAATVTTNANLTGPVTSVGNATTIANNGIVTVNITDSNVTLAKIANIADQRILGNNSGGAAAPIELTVSQVNVMLPVMQGDGAGGAKGLVPAQVGGDATKFLRGDGTWQTIAGGGDALTSNPLSQFAATTSLQLKGVISDETGSGALVFATSPALVTPSLGVASATSVNKVALTTPATAATLTIADNQTLTVNGSATITNGTHSGTNTGDQNVPSNVIGLPYVIDGGGATITTGLKGGYEVPFAMTLTGWTAIGDQSGSIVIDIWKDTYANAPPTVADTITASDKPTISGAQKGQDLAPTGWTTAVNAGDILFFNVDSVTSFQRIAITLRGTKT